jgi:hypothetical protein
MFSIPSGAGPGRPARRTLERETGFEPATPSLEGWRSTAELFPRLPGFTPPRDPAVGLLPVAADPRWWRGEDLNLRRRSPADLQSAPFGHLGTSPFGPWTPVGLAPPADGQRWLRTPSGRARSPRLLMVELAKGIEPPACCLQGSRSTPELRQLAAKLHPMCHPPACQSFFPSDCREDAARPPVAAAAPRTGGRPPRQRH